MKNCLDFVLLVQNEATFTVSRVFESITDFRIIVGVSTCWG